MISIIYANRNRDAGRIKIALDSLQNQNETQFEVVFVDYGSQKELVEELYSLFEDYPFATLYALPVSQLLWNKSKALNYGFKMASNPFVFVADVDLVFHPETIKYFYSIAEEDKFFLFPLNYLNRVESLKLEQEYKFEDLNPVRTGFINGMILTSRYAIEKVWGLDEFFHFYGAEDEDFFIRLENAGFQRVNTNKYFFFHNWHSSFSESEDKLLTTKPRIKNIMRINQRHFQRNTEEKRVRPILQKSWGEVISKEKSEILIIPTKTFRIANVLTWIEYFLNEELTSLGGEVIEAVFYEDPYFGSTKYRLKMLLGRQTLAYISMKEINDMVLKTILFKYRDENYSYSISENLKEIHLKIAL